MVSERSTAARAAAALREARRAFAADDYSVALARISQAVALNDLSPAVLELFDILLDAVSPEEVSALLGDLLDDAWGDWPAAFHASLSARRFDALRELPTADPDLLAAAARDTLEAAAGGDSVAWQPVADPDRRAALLAALSAPADTLLALEQLAYAPAGAGLRAHAAALAESFGFAHQGDFDLARAAERALFALGESAAAHRLETARKAARPLVAPERTRSSPPRLAGRTIVIAGGHDRLRAAIRDDLRGLGLTDLREVPPTWEGQLGTRLRWAVRGADLVLLIIPQLDHSTGDGVTAAATAEGVPVGRVRSASVSAVRAATSGLAPPHHDS